MDFLPTFRLCCLTLIMLFSSIQRTHCRTTGLHEDLAPHEEARQKREVSEEAAPYVEGRTFRASEPLDPDIPTAEEGGYELFGGNFEASHTIFEPTVTEGGATETHAQGEATADSQTQGSAPLSSTLTETETGDSAGDQQTDNEGSRRDHTAQNPYSETGSSFSGGVTGASEYVPGDFDRQEYVPGYVEAYSTEPGSEVASGSSFTGQDGSVVQRRTVVVGGGGGYRPIDQSNTSSSQTEGSVPQRRTYYQTRRRQYNPTGFDRVTGNRRVVVAGSSSTSDVPTGPGSYPIDSQSQYLRPNRAEYCPSGNIRVTINGLTCSDAIDSLGPFVCYNHERASRECCQRCLAIKDSSNTGCEYGDRTYQCRNIQPFDCYVERNRHICCRRCQQFLEQSGTVGRSRGCEYGDLTPRCQSILQSPHLCYLPENQRLCCVTCPRLANVAEPYCQWGNQNPVLCQPFDDQRRLKINCYLPAVQEVCCSTCRSLRERMPLQLPGCEYGDSPLQFSTQRGLLDCRDFIRLYGVDNCDNPQVSRACCFTCHRYNRYSRWQSK